MTEILIALAAMAGCYWIWRESEHLERKRRWEARRDEEESLFQRYWRDEGYADH